MKLRTLAVPLLVLGLVASCKKTPEGTTPPGETSGDATAGGGDGGSGDAGGGDAGGDSGGEKTGGDGGGEPAADGPDPNKVCDAENEDPKALFGDNVLIRLPKGVDLVEQTPFFARITSSNTISTCDAVVSFAAVGYFQTDTSKTVPVIRDETIKSARGVDAGTVTWTEETTKNRDYSAAYEIPEGPKGEPPIKGWIQFKEKGGTTFWTAFETHPNAWNAVKKSFQVAGQRLLVVPPKK